MNDIYRVDARAGFWGLGVGGVLDSYFSNARRKVFGNWCFTLV